MNSPFKKFFFFVLFSATCVFSSSRASLVGVRDIDGNLTVLLNGTPYVDTAMDLAVRVGSWNAGTSVFTLNPASANGGFFSPDTSFNLSATLEADDNLVTGPNGTPFTIGIYNQDALSGNPALASSQPLAVLTDTSWVLPSFTTGGSQTWFALGNTTTAVRGTYDFNGGSQIITLVPEPSTGSLLMIGAAGLVALRRLRKV